MDPSSFQRDALVESGTRLFHERGYSATGVRQVAAAAGVPIGSFTNHYRSKERFALDVLARYVDHLDRIMSATLADTDREPMARIEAYFDAIGTSLEQRAWAAGCLVPDLATDASPHSDALRRAVVRVMERQTAAFAKALTELVGEGAADDIAAVLLAAWHGTLLRMKAERSAAPIARFRAVLRRLSAAPPHDGLTGSVTNQPPADR